MASFSDVMQMCRLCLVKDQVNLPIFGGQGDLQQIFLKITACLPVKVSREDNLPKNICDGCSYKLDMLYQFWNTSSNSEKQLIDWLNAAGVDPKHKSLETPLGITTQPNVILKQEPVTELDSISSDTQNYIMQQQQLAYKPEEFVDSFKESQATAKSTKKKAAEPAEEAPSKRPRRATRSTRSVVEDEEEEDDFLDNVDSGITKTEDDSDEDDDDGDDDGGMPDADPDFETLDEDADADADADADQPGPSGVSGSKASTGPISTKEEIDTFLRTLEWDREGVQCPCTGCSYICKSNKFAMKRHMYFCHIFERPYECSNCDKKFQLPVFLREHMINHIAKASEERFECQLCQKVLKRKFALRNHSCVASLKTFQCDVCGKKFYGRIQLKNHVLKVHSDPIVCELCGVVLDNYNKYRHHKDVHTGKAEEAKKRRLILTKYSHICSVCGKKLSTKASLEDHMDGHNGVKRYACTMCDKSFTARTHMRVHMRIHTGDKPYSCKFCGKVFTRVGGLKKHLRNIHGDIPKEEFTEVE